MARDDASADVAIAAYQAGDILVWRISADKIEEFADKVDGRELGSWSSAEIGLGGGNHYFDVILDIACSEMDIFLTFSRRPNGIY